MLIGSGFLHDLTLLFDHELVEAASQYFWIHIVVLNCLNMLLIQCIDVLFKVVQLAHHLALKVVPFILIFARVEKLAEQL